jgi:hypothetical protein
MNTSPTLATAEARATPLFVHDILDVADHAELQAVLDATQVRWMTARAFHLHVRQSLFYADTEPMPVLREGVSP